MLQLHPPPPTDSRDDVFSRRGRSRGVAATAKARKDSEERRTCAAVDAVQRLFFVPPSSPRASPSPKPISSEPSFVDISHAPPSPDPLGYQSQRSSVSSLHSFCSRSTSSTMVSIASPVPLKTAIPPPFLRSPVSESPSPTSSASMSPDCYDAPPCPTRLLEDQIHSAYVADDIHLAKIILLRLRGIEVTSDDDPRIEAVRDEDFDEIFIPKGGLMDENDERIMKERYAKEREARLEQQRQLRLQECELKWDQQKRRMQEERLKAARRREALRQHQEEYRLRAEMDARRRVEEEQRERTAHERVMFADMYRIAHRTKQRKVVNYRSTALLQPKPQPTRDGFVYDFPAPVPKVPENPSAVPFSDVLNSIDGLLFPVSHDRRRQPSTSRQRKQARLFEAVLVDIAYAKDERSKRKGKQPAHLTRIYAPCLACSAMSSPSPSPLYEFSPASIPRTSSWISFRGTASSSASSSTTDLTALSSSSMSSAPWFIRPKSSLSDPMVQPALRHSCPRHNRLVSVPLSDTPLNMDTQQAPRSEPLSHLGRQRSTSTVRAAREGAGVLVRRMSKFVEIAKGLQTAYASAVLSSGLEDREDRLTEDGNMSPSSKDVKPIAVTPRRPKLRPAGYRVSSHDVAKFLDPSLNVVSSPTKDGSTSENNRNNLGRYIPLTPPHRPSVIPRTVLPDPLPFPTYFKPVLSPSRSPFRFHALSELHTMYPSSAPSPPHMTGQVTWRIRSVGNPVHMRLKALHNLMRKDGILWEGNGPDTALGAGRERVIGVAYENLGATKFKGPSSSASSLSLN